MHETRILTADELYSDAGNGRIETVADEYRRYFESNGCALRFFSAPGRVEICGNHTDHNNGKVLAASINCDIIAAVEPIDVGKAVVKFEDLPEIGIWFEDLSAKADGESENTYAALVKGILKEFYDKGLKVGGFKAYVVSDIKSAWLARDAAFETLISTVISFLFNEGKVKHALIAQICERAESRVKMTGSYMDKLACAHGGFIAIDFKDAASPIVEKVPVDFSKFGHCLCIVDTGTVSPDLASEYSSISAEMRKVAGFFDVKRLRQIAKQDITLNINALREEFGDRAILRSLHFFDENERVDKLAHALRAYELAHFLEYIKDSGNSSYKYLQNVYTSFDSEHESISLGLYFCESVLKGKGACRIHGEGFSGAIQAFVPLETAKTFKVNIERIFGANSCHILDIRPHGGIEIIPSD